MKRVTGGRQPTKVEGQVANWRDRCNAWMHVELFGRFGFGTERANDGHEDSFKSEVWTRNFSRILPLSR